MDTMVVDLLEDVAAAEIVVLLIMAGIEAGEDPALEKGLLMVVTVEVGAEEDMKADQTAGSSNFNDLILNLRQRTPSRRSMGKWWWERRRRRRRT